MALSLAILVIIAVGVLTSVQASATLEEDVADDITALSETQAAQLDDWLTTSRRNVRSTSRLPVFTEGTGTEKQQRLERLQTNEELPPGVVAVHYLDTETNEIRASSNRDFIGVNAEEQGAPFATNPPQFEGPDDTHVTKPFSVSLVDHPIIAVVSPIPGADDRALVYMINLGAKADQISNQREGSFTTVVGTDGEFVSHPDTSMIGSTAPISQMESDPLGTLKPGESSFHETDSMLMGLTKLESQDWVVMVHSDPEVAYALSDQINSDLIGLILLAVVNLGLIGVTIGGNTIASLRRLSAKAEAMADGDLDINLETSREDEFGTLYAAFDNMRTNLRTQISEAETAREEAERAKEQAEAAREDVESERNEMEALTGHLELKAQQYSDALEAAANGDLTARVDTDSMNEAMAEVGEDINTTLDALEDTIADMKAFATNVIQSSDRVNSNAERVDRASKQVSKSINEIFEGTTEQNEGLESAAAEMQNLSATAQQVASSAQQVADTSQSAAEVGEDGREAAQEAIAEMSAIEDETGETVEEINALDDELDEIGEIVGVITSIVEQTNMLALNASIEAAHADGDGEGFAVVADEIKGLAEETKEAAADIEQRIEGIQEQAGDTVETMESTSTRITEGVSTVEETVDALETIVEYTEEVDTGIQEIDRATEEQARTAQDVMGTIDDLTTISQQTATEADTVAGAAQDQSASIDEVSDSATELRQRADDLESLLDRFTVENSAGTDTDSTAVVGDD
ncbi:methyl-accepting chemotaxis protein [Haloarcula japonica]|uniref:MCP domain-containing signal transducer n=1 Tax=Haloarcula japonica (strain ATCC 49778 / DSM 6131 / JCM 7785 / NBRC 101032 / NCIMB 13157 / TR-1) TaxID=1227453 RepID=M0LDE3_HALJT|nr:methyl-accepting chemotaxis protein [Haloarcula japonica]EMA29975.1 MCP domain-containing signal transducer [Haloarcula japonica DSM 6131]